MDQVLLPLPHPAADEERGCDPAGPGHPDHGQDRDCGLRAGEQRPADGEAESGRERDAAAPVDRRRGRVPVPGADQEEADLARVSPARDPVAHVLEQRGDLLALGVAAPPRQHVLGPAASATTGELGEAPVDRARPRRDQPADGGDEQRDGQGEEGRDQVQQTSSVLRGLRSRCSRCGGSRRSRGAGGRPRS